MSESSDTSTIDEKKQDSKSKNKGSYYSNIGSFLFTVFIIFIIFIIYYSSSGLILYACKLAQSNILPTDIHCSPYTDTKPNIQPIQTNIFTTYTEPQLSMKLKFQYNEYNSSNKIIDMFNEYKNEARSNFLANYFISIIETIIQFNYSSLNTILNMLNGLPEFLLVIFGPIIVSIITMFIFLADNIYLVYLWFVNMSWFFKINTNDSGTGKPKWEDVTFVSPFNYACAIGLLILFAILFFFSMPLLSVLSFLSIVYCLFSCIFYAAEFNGNNITSATVIQDVFKYYKTPIISIFSFLVIVSAFTKLGTIPGVVSIVTVALIYFGIISIDIFKPINKEYLSKLVSNKQAKKICSYNETLQSKHGALYSMLFGQSGGNITKELKNIGKHLHRK